MIIAVTLDLVKQENQVLKLNLATWYDFIMKWEVLYVALINKWSNAVNRNTSVILFLFSLWCM